MVELNTDHCPDVVAVNRTSGFLLLDNDECIAIDAMYDIFGEETENSEDAVFCTAQLPDKRWLSVDLTMFDQETIH